MGVPLPGIEYGIAASAIALGLAVMFEARPPLAIAAVIVAIFAIFHGHAHGTELPPGQSGLLYSMGFVIATGCLHGVGISIGTVHRWDWGQKFLRLAGAVVAMGGVFFMWKAFHSMKQTTSSITPSALRRSVLRLRDVSPRSSRASELHRHGPHLRRPDALPDEPRRPCPSVWRSPFSAACEEQPTGDGRCSCFPAHGCWEDWQDSQPQLRTEAQLFRRYGS